ncbi:SHOCT domain-containing protein [Halopiger aswanensis]|uniref:Putative oligomerization/nucleic acid binding protein n=1 Tax=Halopiger aswanensis TaxID=148449 RepID=A0A419WSD0_9EURY|nr:SHOCT domain-containing protein [Halopiger aswanensis]RKD98306.1 putative oligomerization/nucleic acid binding protein [Halopiger aswanensis]
MVSRRWLYFGGFIASTALLLGVGLLGVLDALSVLSGSVPRGEEFILLAMVGEAAEWIALGLGLGLLAALFLAATVVSVLRSASLPRSDRLVALVERLEREYPVLRQFDVAETVEPTPEDRRQRLKEQYVDGEISEAEFERRMETAMDDDLAESSRSGTTTVDVEERS